jgi:hypothetical protein
VILVPGTPNALPPLAPQGERGHVNSIVVSCGDDLKELVTVSAAATAPRSDGPWSTLAIPSPLVNQIPFDNRSSDCEWLQIGSSTVHSLSPCGKNWSKTWELLEIFVSQRWGELIQRLGS